MYALHVPRDSRDDDLDDTTTVQGARSDPPPIEVVLSRDERVLSAGATSPIQDRYRVLEVWTRNRIYVIDSGLICVEVIDRRTNMAEPDHSLLGSRLVGGQRKYKKTLHLSRPFPVPGTEAVFVREDRRHSPSGLTSKVERVVLHVHIASIAMEEGKEAWEDVTSHVLRSKFGANF